MLGRTSLAVTVNHAHAERKRGIPSAFVGIRYTKQWQRWYEELSIDLPVPSTTEY